MHMQMLICVSHYKAPWDHQENCPNCTTGFYPTVTLYSSGSNQKSLQLSSSFKLWRVPYKPSHKQQRQQGIPRRILSAQIIEIVVNKRCSNWNIHFFSLFPHSFCNRLMSQSGLVSPSMGEREAQFVQPSSQRGLCQSDL